MSKTSKNKYSCLNKDCLKHSWVCRDHAEENKPLFDTHCKEMADKKQNITFSLSPSHLHSTFFAHETQHGTKPEN